MAMAISPTFQAFLTKHATEPGALAAFFRDPEAVLGISSLSDDEKKMVREWDNDASAHSPPPTCPWPIGGHTNS
jgi:hypothetical protein